MTDITLGLVPGAPAHRAGTGPFRQLGRRLDLGASRSSQADVSAVELLDQLAMTLCRDVPEYSRLLQTFSEGDPNCILIVEFQGDRSTSWVRRSSNLETLLRGEGGRDQRRPRL